MKSIEFDENQLNNLGQISQALFDVAGSDDPRSLSYRRVLIRPRINWLSIILHVAIPALIVLCIYILLRHFGVGVIASYTVSAIFFLVYFCLNAKRCLISVIRIYQRYTPEAVRNKCRFEPSCSEYMILAVQKYGLRKGLIMGIRRLKRCNIHDGGYDYP